MSSSVAKRADAIRHITPHDGSSRSDVQCTAATGAACSSQASDKYPEAFAGTYTLSLCWHKRAGLASFA